MELLNVSGDTYLRMIVKLWAFAHSKIDFGIYVFILTKKFRGFVRHTCFCQTHMHDTVIVLVHLLGL